MSNVKNKAVAPLQISAEQILLEAFERKDEPLKAPKQSIADLEELKEFQGRKRQEYEEALRRNRLNTGQWIRYAEFEVEQREYERARSVFERALDVESTNIPLWIRYIKSELKERNINHARNLLDRAVAILPRVDKLWFLYVGVEETLSNISGCRQVFERWMTWRPSAAAWNAYINMEKRYGEYENGREIFHRFTAVHPQSENWIKWARFEEEFGTADNVRDVYTLAVDTMGEEFMDEKILVNWAKWETRQHEWERARAIYTYGLERLSKSKSMKLYNSYTSFEKQYGGKDGIENVILSKRRVGYEDQVKEDPYNYDAWFSYLTLLEEAGSQDEIREVYERSISNIPSKIQKKYWRRYIFLWIRYAVYEELVNNDEARAREIYQQCLKVIPHKAFTFAKIWLLFAKFELRHGTTPDTARKILGQAIGLSKSLKAKIFKGYIEIEKQLKEFDRCRKLYEKYIDSFPDIPQPWIEYANLEQDLGDEDRARGIYELAIQQADDHGMEMPELVWKRYIEFEAEEGNYHNSRNLFETLLERANHVKVWISYATFELSIPENEDEDEEEEHEPSAESRTNARRVYERAWDKLKKDSASKEDRVVLHSSWLQFEETYGTEETIQKVQNMKPSMVKKRRKLDENTVEEYIDYVFPTDEQDKSYSKLLENAKKWKQQKAATN